MKKLLALLLAMAMVLSLAACGGAAASGSSAAEAPAEEAAPAGDNVLKIGALINTTGWFASIDYNNQIEMETLCKYYNDQGGIDIGGTKYQLELVVEDGGSDAEGIRSAAQRLVDQDAGVGKGRTLALLAGTEQDGAHRGGHAGADGPDRRGYKLHCVVDCKTGAYLSARCVQIERDIRLVVQRCQEEQLGLDNVCDIVVDGYAQKDDAVHEQTAEDVH